jgi:hypothetical protein
MTKRINWDQVARQQKGRKQGMSNAYDELPPVGSWADQQRFMTNKSRAKKKSKRARVKTIAGLKKEPPKSVAACPVCGRLVSMIKRHLRKAHGAELGHEQEAENESRPKDDIEP